MPKVTQEHLDARRAEILDGARRAFAEHGYEGATVARLEEATGLSRGALRIGNIPIAAVPSLAPLLKPGLAAYVSLHWSQAPTMAQPQGPAPTALPSGLRPGLGPSDRIRSTAAA